MLQDSKIQEGYNAGVAAPDIDYGPYSGAQWARLFRILFTGDQEAEQGVVHGYLGEFLTWHVGTTVSITEGAGLCRGHFLVGVGAPDWSVVVTPPAAGHTRCDYVVMLENNTVGVYAPGAATMQCPNTADYGGIANQVPEFACRLAIIKGAEDAACPPATFTQTAALWMTPLAKIEWDVAQAIDTLTDMRHYIGEKTTRVLLTLGARFDISPFIPYVTHTANFYGWAFPHSSDDGATGYHWLVPDNLVHPEDLRLRALFRVVPGALPAAIRLFNAARVHTPDCADVSSNTTGDIEETLPLAVSQVVCVGQWIPFLTHTHIIPGGILSGQVQRKGLHADDTLDADIYAIGIELEYRRVTLGSD